MVSATASEQSPTNFRRGSRSGSRFAASAQPSSCNPFTPPPLNPQPQHVTRMKKFLSIIVILFAGCASLTPQQATTLADVESAAVNAGIGYLTGGAPGAIAAASPSAIAALQSATLALRMTENPKSAAVPSAAQINSLIVAVAQNPQVAKAITKPVASAVASAVRNGAGSPASAVEAAAKGLDTVATAYAP